MLQQDCPEEQLRLNILQQHGSLCFARICGNWRHYLKPREEVLDIHLEGKAVVVEANLSGWELSFRRLIDGKSNKGASIGVSIESIEIQRLSNPWDRFKTRAISGSWH
jgi:hypothetical protein